MFDKKVDDKFLRDLETKVLKYRFRIKDDNQRKTYDEVFDQTTLLTLYDMMSSDILNTLDFPIATGKEGNVFRATTPKGDFIAVKIYRMTNSSFNSIQKYIVGDERFRGIGKNKRRLIQMWAKKEYRNLERMSHGKVIVPKPIKCQKNILAMEFIGKDGEPAPTLKDIGTSDPQGLFDELYNQLKIIYNDVGLVHSDFSEYNVLMLGDQPKIIDVGQAVLRNHPMAKEFLARDFYNFVNYFKKYGIKADAGELFKELAGED
jgi:RIO kinase 1